MSIQVIGFGTPLCDRCVTVTEEVLEKQNLIVGSSNLATLEEVEQCWKECNGQAKPTLGGSCTNVLKAMGTFGVNCTIVGKVGNDDKGNCITKNLNGLGIKTILPKGNQSTGTVNCLVTHSERGIDRTMQTYLGAALEFCEDDITECNLTESSLAHIEGYLIYNGYLVEAIVERALASNTKISLDLASIQAVQNCRERFCKIIKKVDYLFGNAQEVMALTDETLIEKAIHALPKPEKNRMVVITNGKKGCYVQEAPECDLQQFPALPLNDDQVIDVTGAGDYFLAGFMQGVLRGKSVAECVSAANLAAGHVIQVIGTDLPETRKAEIRSAFL